MIWQFEQQQKQTEAIMQSSAVLPFILYLGQKDTLETFFNIPENVHWPFPCCLSDDVVLRSPRQPDAADTEQVDEAAPLPPPPSEVVHVSGAGRDLHLAHRGAAGHVGLAEAAAQQADSWLATATPLPRLVPLIAPVRRIMHLHSLWCNDLFSGDFIVILCHALELFYYLELL